MLCALLKLPATWTKAAKLARVDDILHELVRPSAVFVMGGSGRWVAWGTLVCGV